MTIDSLKELEQLIKLCRKQGVTTVKTSCGMELQLGSLPSKPSKARRYAEDPMASLKVPEPNLYDPIAQAKAAAAKAKQDLEDYIQTDEPTEEQLLNWSTRPESFEGQQ